MSDEAEKVMKERKKLLDAFTKLKVEKGVKKDRTDFLLKQQEMLRR